MTPLQVSGVSEQSVDLLLWEELSASPEFLSWFLAEATIPGRVDLLLSAARSVWSIGGESDLVLVLRIGTDSVKVLIENKVGAPLQPRQAERYRERSVGYVTEGSCNRSLTVIVAPTSYFVDGEDCCGFDRRVTYEAVLEWFEHASSLGARARCKVEILRAAIRQGVWKSKPDKVATKFWRSYWERASEIAPELRMVEPRDRPATSCFIPFRPSGLARGETLLHKFVYGHVDLQFAGAGNQVAEIERRCGPLDADMHVERAGKSAVVRIVVPRIVDMATPFSTSQPTVDLSIQAAGRLMALYKRVGLDGGWPEAVGADPSGVGQQVDPGVVGRIPRA